jgi:hypothetical protein
VGEFPDAPSLIAAVRALRDRGYERLETYSPMPLPELEGAMRYPRSWLPSIVFAGGVAGALVSYFIQWYANAYSYPLNIGGRPAHATTAFMIPTFEGAVLAASLTAFFGLWFIVRLPTYWHAMFELPGFERASVDRYWVAIAGDDARAGGDMTPRELRELGAVRVVVLGEEAAGAAAPAGGPAA